MKEFTGYNVEDIAKCAVHIHFKWYVHKEFNSKPLIYFSDLHAITPF